MFYTKYFTKKFTAISYKKFFIIKYINISLNKSQNKIKENMNFLVMYINRLWWKVWILFVISLSRTCFGIYRLRHPFILYIYIFLFFM